MSLITAKRHQIKPFPIAVTTEEQNTFRNYFTIAIKKDRGVK